MTVLITDHTAAAIARMIEKRKALPNWGILLTAAGAQVQALEQAFYDLLVLRQIDTGIGQQLDDIGAIVGQPRNSVSDADYRRYLAARVAVSNSEGRISDVIRVARSVLSDASLTLTVQSSFPAEILVKVANGAVSTALADILIEFLRDVPLGGVRLISQTHPTAASESFTLGTVTETTGIVTAVDTALPVADTTYFSDTGGTAVVDPSGVQEETITYTHKSTTHLLGMTGNTEVRAAGQVVRTGDSALLGYDDDAAPGTGGKFASALE